MDLYTAIHERRDETAWAPETPAREVLERIIEAAVWAPNHRLTEPWRFVVLAGHARSELADAIVAHLKGNPAQISVEMARGSVPTTMQPSFLELEEAIQGLAPA